MSNKEKIIKVEPQTQEIFFNAVKNNNIEKVKNIVESEVPIIDAKCINDALILASEKENLEIVKYLVEFGADVNTKYEYEGIFSNKHIKTSLSIASEKEDLEMVKYLVEKGADVDYEYKDYNKVKTALSIASEKENLEIVKYLIKKSAKNINDTLIFASENGYLELVKCLLELGADVNYEYKDYNKVKTALSIALEKEDLEMVKYLVEKGANDINGALSVALEVALEKENLEMVKYLSEHVDIYAKNNALAIASSCGKLGVVKCLVENGADIITARDDKDGKVALIHAVENGYLRIVAYFIENGIDINAKYFYYYKNLNKYDRGVTILMIASFLGELEIVKYLIKKGADVNIESYNGLTALEFVRYGLTEIGSRRKYEYGKIMEILSKEWLNKNYPNEKENNDYII